MTNQANSTLTYDVVIATKDRPHLISYSLRSLFEQTIPPRRVIMVDASRKHDEVVMTAESIREMYDLDTDLLVLPSHPSKAAQVNKGLGYVESPIVMIPDDDSVFLPDAAEHVLRVYERDVEQVIGGVELTETRTPPPIVASREAQDARRASLADRIIYRFAGIKARMVNLIADNPLRTAGQEMLDSKRVPDWLSEVAAIPVPFLLGFRMTFRSNVVKRYKMNEVVVRGVRFDDYELSLSVLKSHLLVRTMNGLVYHHRAGGSRDSGMRTGISLLLNRCYIACLHTPPGSAARRSIRRYTWRMYVDYSLRAYSKFGRQRLRGIRQAAKWVPYLLDSPPDEIHERYQYAFDQAERQVAEVSAGESRS